MKIISTTVHGVLDYMMGIALILSPWILKFDRGGAETWIPVVTGVVIIMYSLCTNYELGTMKYISMGTHLYIDLVIGFFLAWSPWIAGFNEYVYIPHLAAGIISFVVPIFSEKKPREYGRTKIEPLTGTSPVRGKLKHP